MVNNTKTRATTAEIDEIIAKLFPINRSLSGNGNEITLKYLKDKLIQNAKVKSIASGKKVFDWTIPPEWNVDDAYVKNKNGKKIIDFKKNNLHLMSYSAPFHGRITKDELLNHLHTLPKHPNWIPYRTSYFSEDWAFCCADNLLNGDDFLEPFEVKIDSKFDKNGKLVWLEAFKKGETDREILISSYFCHPSLANDNLSGFITAAMIFRYLTSAETRFSYRLIIVPETIGAITFLATSDNVNKIEGGMVLTCVGGPDQLSIKEGFDNSHWINKAAHMALADYTSNDYTTYPFTPDGSDERQYSSPKFRIVTPSIHKSKYYEYDQYHTSADDLNFISAESILESINVHVDWINLIESFSMPKRKTMACEDQLGSRGLYPLTGGTLNQRAHVENSRGFKKRLFNFNQPIKIHGEHLRIFNWLMHLSDGTNSNFEIAKRAEAKISIVNEAIALFYQKGLIDI
jgi:aminopeptidase-like protein